MNILPLMITGALCFIAGYVSGSLVMVLLIRRSVEEMEGLRGEDEF
jgi:predicted ABC-class ATPase